MNPLDHWTNTLDHPQNPRSTHQTRKVVQDPGPKTAKPQVRDLDHWTPLRGGGHWSTHPHHGRAPAPPNTLLGVVA